MGHSGTLPLPRFLNLRLIFPLYMTARIVCASPAYPKWKNQKEWIKKRHPGCKFFMKPLSPTMPYGYERQGEEAVALYKDLASLVDWEAEKRRMDDQMRACRAEYEKQKTDNGGRR